MLDFSDQTRTGISILISAADVGLILEGRFNQMLTNLPQLESSKGILYNQKCSKGILYLKETILERAEFTLQLLMFVTAEKERRMSTNFLSLQFLTAVVPAVLSKDRLSASRP